MSISKVDTITVELHIKGTDSTDYFSCYNNEDDTSIAKDIHYINLVLQ